MMARLFTVFIFISWYTGALPYGYTLFDYLKAATFLAILDYAYNRAETAINVRQFFGILRKRRKQ
jgi:hypothetical protein